jgi:hypothetical protein
MFEFYRKLLERKMASVRKFTGLVFRGSMKMIRIYCDSGADISKLKSFFVSCEFYQFPYDSPDRPKRPLLLAKPSKAQWRDCHAAWMEFSEITWDDFIGSSLHPQIEAIIGTGPENRRDVLHFDSAYKTACKVFLTSDKGNIWSKKDALESLAGIKIFHTPFELEGTLEYLSMLVTSVREDLPDQAEQRSSFQKQACNRILRRKD